MIRFKEKLKKGIAIASAISFMGATVLAQSSLDLANYPEPFIKDGKFDTSTAIVVGENAMASDTLGAVDIATNLQYLSGDILEETQVIGISDEITLGSPVNTEISSPIKNYKLEDLKDGEVFIGGDSYDYHEEILLGDGLIPETSLTSNENDYAEKVALEVNKGDLVYSYVFDDNINIEDEVSTEDSLEVNILGNKLKIISADNDEFTAYVGKEYYMGVGDTVKVDDKEVTLFNVGSSESVVVIVDGTQETIPSGKTEYVNGIEITNDEAFYENDREERTATLIIGKNSLETFKDRDAFIGEDEDDPLWIWEIDNLDTNNPLIQVKNDFTYNDANDDVIYEEECYEFPNNYLQVCFDKIIKVDYLEYDFRYEDSYDLSDVSGYSDSEDVFLFRATDDEAFDVVNGKKTDEIAIYLNGTNIDVFYKDNGDIELADTYSRSNEEKIATLTFEDTDIDLTLNVTGKYLIMDSIIPDDTLKVKFSNTKITDFIWNSKSLVNTDEDLRTKYGIIIRNPENNFDDTPNGFEIELPSEQVKAKVSIGLKSSEKKTQIIEPRDITIDTRLHTEILDKTAHNLIFVGGACAGGGNSLIESFSGLPSCQEFRDNYESGEAIIKLIRNGDKVAMLVAGYDALDTRVASKVVADWEDYDLSGTEMLITGTLSNPNVKKVA